jgi:hypothetical protein
MLKKIRKRRKGIWKNLVWEKFHSVFSQKSQIEVF